MKEGFSGAALGRVFAARRASLASLLSGKTAVFASGQLRYRNIPAIPYPFRASSHVLYLTGILPPQSVLLVGPDGSLLFLSDSGLDDEVWNGSAEPRAALGERTGIAGIYSLNDLQLALSKINSAELCAIPSIDLATNAQITTLLGRAADLAQRPDRELAVAIAELRMIHDKYALGEMERAASATAQAFAQAMSVTRPGLFEYQVKAPLAAAIQQAGMQEAFAAGCSVRGEILHNASQQGQLADGDLLLVDFGAECPSGYSADVTRVWPVNGRFTALQRDVYRVVLQTQEAAIAAVKPGVRFGDLHFLAVRVMTEGLIELGALRGSVDSLIERGAHTLFFPHGLGHLLGLDTHDLEDLGDIAGYPEGRKRSDQFGTKFLRLDRDLSENMVFTIEPGWYWIPALLENLELRTRYKDCLIDERVAELRSVRGVRIEDNILVTAAGAHVLTAAIPKEISAVEQAVDN